MRKSNSSRVWLTAGTAALALLIGACGSDTKSPQTSASNTSGSQPASSPTASNNATTPAPSTDPAVSSQASDLPLTVDPSAAPSAGSETSAATNAPTGSVTIYAGRDEKLVAPILEKFTAQTGIEVQARYAGSGELGAQILTEGEASPADLFFSQDAGALGAVSKAGLFDAIPAETLARVPEFYSAADGTWLGVSGRARVIVYNPDLAPTPPDTIDGLLDQQWKGKIAFAPSNASWQAFVTGLRVLRGDDGAKAWLTAFADLEPIALEKNGDVRDAVNAGEATLGLVNHYYLYQKIAADGPDNVVAKNQFMKAGDAGGLVNVAGIGILKSSVNKEAAQALAAYLVSDDAQRYFADQTKEFPLVAGVDSAAEVPALSELAPPQIDLSDLDDLAVTQELLVETGLLTK